MTSGYAPTLPYPYPPTWRGTSPSYDCTVIHSPNYIPHNSNVRILPTPPPCVSKMPHPGGIYILFKPLANVRENV